MRPAWFDSPPTYLSTWFFKAGETRPLGADSPSCSYPWPPSPTATDVKTTIRGESRTLRLSSSLATKRGTESAHSTTLDTMLEVTTFQGRVTCLSCS